jgi:hypothetical protein
VIQKVSIAAALLLVCNALQAATAEQLKSCIGIDNPAQRLACYDHLAGRETPSVVEEIQQQSIEVKPIDIQPVAGTAVATATASAASALEIEPAKAESPSAVKEDAEALFGLEHKQRLAEQAPSALTLKMVEKEKDAYGKWVITFENGQVWRQTDSARYSFSNDDNLVVITRGAMGGFFISEPERNRRFRAKRVK